MEAPPPSRGCLSAEAEAPGSGPTTSSYDMCCSETLVTSSSLAWHRGPSEGHKVNLQRATASGSHLGVHPFSHSPVEYFISRAAPAFSACPLVRHILPLLTQQRGPASPPENPPDRPQNLCASSVRMF